MRVAVLAGGLSYEREVSLRSGTRAADALRDCGVDATLLDVGPDVLDRLGSDRPDAALVALHGASGEDGTVRTLLDLLAIPQVGTPAALCRATWDKPTLKALLSQGGVRVPRGITLPQTTFSDLGAAAVVGLLVESLPLPHVVKPARGGSALGVSLVREASQLPAALVSCFGYDDTALVESAVPGTEVALCVLDTGAGPEPLPAVEIAPADGLFDYAARYTPGRTEYHVPARLSPEVADRLSRSALEVHRLLGLRDISRMDAIVGRDGEPVVLEVNTSPGLTETSLLPMALTASGRDLGPTLRDLLASAATRGIPFP